MILTALMLAAAIVPGPQTSHLVEEGHSHEWVEAFADNDGTAWIDSTWESAREVDGFELPLFLMRTEMTLDGEPPVIVDIAMAVDCENNLMGIAGAWTEAEGANLHGAEWLEDIAMDLVEEPLGDDDIAIFQIACGPNWQS